MKTIAIVGRTNVGKSTLFNRLCGRRVAIVHDRAGVTRDRKEAEATLKDLTFRLIDTAGLEETTELAEAMWRQTELAMAEADIVLMLVDGRAELTRLDERLGGQLRRLDKPVFVLANKCEGKPEPHRLAEFYRLGLGDPVPVSAEHGLGLDRLYALLKPLCPAEDKAAAAETVRPLKLAIVGRPNVGKSTLINRLVGQNRLLTGPTAGVTRDAITVPWEWKGNQILLTDTAGLRKYGKVDDELERISAADTRNAIDFAEVVVLVLDANQPLERQDLMIASKVLDEGRGLILALNKWDTVANQRQVMNDLKEKMEESLQQVKGLPVVTVSAKTGYGIEPMMTTIFHIYKLWNKRVSTHKMNDFLKMMTQAHPTPIAGNGRRIPMKYMTQVSARPPTFVIFSSNPDSLPESYLRYLSNGIREEFGLVGVPIRIYMRKRENPFANKPRRPCKKEKPARRS